MNTNTPVMEVVIAELEQALTVLEKNYKSAVTNLNMLRECVDTDDLTKLLRRGAFMRKLETLLQASRNDGREVTIMMIDVDHFKGINDSHGHQTGDVVLEQISELIRNYLRPNDLAGRYGGEEIIVAVQADEVEANRIAERIRAAVEGFTMVSKSHVEFKATLSAGLASTREFSSYEADILIGQADAALYRAKGSGRNRVEAARNPVAVTTAA